MRDADKVEMMIQCLRYELSGSRGLDDFWAGMDRQDVALPALCGHLRAAEGDAAGETGRAA